MRTILSYFLNIYILFFIYSDVPIALRNNIYIPSFPLLIILPVLMILAYRHLKLTDIYLPFSLMMIALFSIVFSGNIFILPSLISKLIQYFTAILSSVIVFIYFKSSDKKKFCNSIYLFCYFIFFGVLFERIGLLRPVTELYRNVFFKALATDGGDLLMNTDRDLDMLGFLRPIYFTSEPAHVSMGFFVFTSVASMLKRTFKGELIMFSLSVLGIFLIGSPVSFLNVFIILLIIIYKWKVKIPKAYVLISFTIFVSIISVTPIFSKLLERFYTEINAESSSLFARLYQPYVVILPKIITHVPLWGVGFGCYDSLHDLMGFPHDVDPYLLQFIRGANAFCNHIIYLGLLGFLISVFLVKKYLRKKGIKSFYLVGVAWFFSGQAIGTFVTPAYWNYLFLFVIGILIMEKHTRNEEEII